MDAVTVLPVAVPEPPAAEPEAPVAEPEAPVAEPEPLLVLLSEPPDVVVGEVAGGLVVICGVVVAGAVEVVGDVVVGVVGVVGDEDVLVLEEVVAVGGVAVIEVLVADVLPLCWIVSRTN